MQSHRRKSDKSIFIYSTPFADEVLDHVSNLGSIMLLTPHRILLVEDHEDSAWIIARLLKSIGHQVETAGNCTKAEQLFRTQNFDLLILDLGLPDGDGCTLLRSLSQIRKVPAIAMTGYHLPADIERIQQAGFNLQIVKPIAFDVLKEAVQSIAGGEVPQTQGHERRGWIDRAA